MKILTVLLDQFPSSCQFAQGAEKNAHEGKYEKCSQLLLLPRLPLLHPCTGTRLVEYEGVI